MEANYRKEWASIVKEIRVLRGELSQIVCSLVIVLYPEDGRRYFLRKVGIFLPDYKASLLTSLLFSFNGLVDTI